MVVTVKLMVVAMSDVKPMTASVGASTTSAATPTMAPRPPMDTTTKGNPTLKKDMNWQSHQRLASTGRINALTKQINSYLCHHLSNASKEASYLEANSELNILLATQEAYCAQRSRTTWLAHDEKIHLSFMHKLINEE
ncbi:hypothetical protein V6N13_019978 [Hibiscus sabdariffa]